MDDGGGEVATWSPGPSEGWLEWPWALVVQHAEKVAIQAMHRLGMDDLPTELAQWTAEANEETQTEQAIWSVVRTVLSRKRT